MSQPSSHPQPAMAHITDASVGTYNPLVLTRVLKRATDPGSRGTFHVVSGPSVKTLRFGRGSVRFASSNIRRDRLGETMLAHDFISRSDFRRASDTMKRSGCRFGEALLSMGLLTKDQLNRELAIQAQRIVLSLFRTGEGTYRIEDGDGDDLGGSAPRLPVGLPVSPLLLKGLRSIKDGQLILSGLPPSETRVRTSHAPPPRLNIERLSAAERSVLELAGDGSTIAEIIQRSEFGRVDAFHGCFTLLSLGLLERLPDPPPGPTVEEEPAAKQSLAEDIDRTPLELSPSPGELEAALASLGPKVEDQAGTPRREKARAKGKKVGIPEKLIRTQYERLESVSEASLLGVREDVDLDGLEHAYRGLKHEWTSLREHTDDESLHVKLDAIERRLAAAYANMRFLRAASGAGPTHAVEKVDGWTAFDEATLEEGEELALSASSAGRVEELERELELHFEVRNWSGAISLLHELVNLEPGNPRYHAQLATAMQHHSSSRINAEQHFLEAVRLSPEDPSLHLDLARYYHLVGDAPRARTELRKTLELEPDNLEAQRLLGGGTSRTTMRTLLKRVFG